jgi:hypothetical protein
MAKAKKPAAKKAAAKKAAAKKPVAKKAAAKKPVAAKKPAAKAAPRKPAATKTVAKAAPKKTAAAVAPKVAARKSAATVAAKSAAKKPAAAKPVATPATAKKATAKRATAKKAAATTGDAPTAVTKVGAAFAMVARTVAEVAKGVARAVTGGSPIGDGTRDKPWQLTTPPGTSAFEAFRDETLDPPSLVVRAGKTELRYHLRAIDDLRTWLVAKGDWVALGGADEQKPAPDGSVEAWGRSAENPVQGWYGLKSGLRGRFGVYLPPVLEALGHAEVEHGPRNNRMRAI